MSETNEKNLIFLLFYGKAKEPRENKEGKRKKQKRTRGIRDSFTDARVTKEAEQQIADRGGSRQKESGKPRDKVQAFHGATDIVTHFSQEKECAGEKRKQE